MTKDWFNFTTVSAVVVIIGGLVAAASGVVTSRDTRLSNDQNKKEKDEAADAYAKQTEKLDNVTKQLANALARLAQISDGQLTQTVTFENALYTERMNTVQGILSEYRLEHAGPNIDNFGPWPLDWINRRLKELKHNFRVVSIQNGAVVFGAAN